MNMHIRVRAHMYTHMCTYTASEGLGRICSVYMHMRLCACTYTYTCTYRRPWSHIHLYVYMRLRNRTYTYTCTDTAIEGLGLA